MTAINAVNRYVVQLRDQNRWVNIAGFSETLTTKAMLTIAMVNPGEVYRIYDRVRSETVEVGWR